MTEDDREKTCRPVCFAAGKNDLAFSLLSVPPRPLRSMERREKRRVVSSPPRVASMAPQMKSQGRFETIWMRSVLTASNETHGNIHIRHPHNFRNFARPLPQLVLIFTSEFTQPPLPYHLEITLPHGGHLRCIFPMDVQTSASFHAEKR